MDQPSSPGTRVSPRSLVPDLPPVVTPNAHPQGQVAAQGGQLNGHVVQTGQPTAVASAVGALLPGMAQGTSSGETPTAFTKLAIHASQWETLKLRYPEQATHFVDLFLGVKPAVVVTLVNGLPHCSHEGKTAPVEALVSLAHAMADAGMRTLAASMLAACAMTRQTPADAQALLESLATVLHGDSPRIKLADGQVRQIQSLMTRLDNVDSKARSVQRELAELLAFACSDPTLATELWTTAPAPQVHTDETGQLKDINQLHISFKRALEAGSDLLGNLAYNRLSELAGAEPGGLAADMLNNCISLLDEHNDQREREDSLASCKQALNDAGFTWRISPSTMQIIPTGFDAVAHGSMTLAYVKALINSPSLCPLNVLKAWISLLKTVPEIDQAQLRQLFLALALTDLQGAPAALTAYEQALDADRASSSRTSTAAASSTTASSSSSATSNRIFNPMGTAEIKQLVLVCKAIGTMADVAAALALLEQITQLAQSSFEAVAATDVVEQCATVQLDLLARGDLKVTSRQQLVDKILMLPGAECMASIPAQARLLNAIAQLPAGAVRDKAVAVFCGQYLQDHAEWSAPIKAVVAAATPGAPLAGLVTPLPSPLHPLWPPLMAGLVFGQVVAATDQESAQVVNLLLPAIPPAPAGTPEPVYNYLALFQCMAQTPHGMRACQKAFQALATQAANLQHPHHAAVLVALGACTAALAIADGMDTKLYSQMPAGRRPASRLNKVALPQRTKAVVQAMCFAALASHQVAMGQYSQAAQSFQCFNDCIYLEFILTNRRAQDPVHGFCMGSAKQLVESSVKAAIAGGQMSQEERGVLGSALNAASRYRKTHVARAGFHASEIHELSEKLNAVGELPSKYMDH